MAEWIQASVGKKDGKLCFNRAADKAIVQDLLNRITKANGGAEGALKDPVGADGPIAESLYQAIWTFQRHNAQKHRLFADGHVDPKEAGGKAIVVMNQLAPPAEFTGFSAEERRLVESDLVLAKRFLTNALSRLGVGNVIVPAAQDPSEALRNIFNIDSSANAFFTDGFDRIQVIADLSTVRKSLDEPFPKRAVNEGLFMAWVSNDFSDATVNFARRVKVGSLDDPGYFEERNVTSRVLTLIHERAHTVLKLPGHPGTPLGRNCVVPHEGFRPPQNPRLTKQQAMTNVYCYELLVESLQPGYNPAPFRAAQGTCPVVHGVSP